MTNHDINAQNLGGHEWMGLSACVFQSTDHSRQALCGRIVGETQNTVTLETRAGEKILPKKECILEVELPDQSRTKLDLSKWTFRPEDRVKAFAKQKKRGMTWL